MYFSARRLHRNLFDLKYRREAKMYNRFKNKPMGFDCSGASEFQLLMPRLSSQSSFALPGDALYLEKVKSPMFRNLVKENAFLYWLWFVLIRARQVKGKRRLPQATDHLFFTGFPRSGNTYLASLIAHCFPNLEFTHHLHTVGSIKIALAKNLKTFVVIRNPRDSVGSYLAYHSDDLDSVPTEKQVRHFLGNYYRYFEFLNDRRDVLHFISFENMIVDKKSTIGGIAEILGMPEFKLSDDLLEDYDRKMRKAEAKKDRNAGSLPNEQKRAYKARVSNLITADPNFSQCSDLFSSLEGSTINAN